MHAGSIASSYSMVAMLLAILLGFLVSRIGAAGCVFLGLLTTGAAGMLGATSESYYQLLGTRVAEGVGFVLMAISVPVLITRVVNEKSRPIAMGMWGTFIPGGIALSMLIAPFFENQWRSIWWFSCALMLVCLIGLLVIVVPVLKGIEQSPQTQNPPTPRYPSVLSRDPILLALSFLLYSSFFIALITYLPTLLSETAFMSQRAATITSAAVVVFNAFGNIFSGIMISRGAALKTVLTTALLGATLFAGVVFSDWVYLPIRVLSGMLACFLGGMLPAAVFTSVPSFVSARKSGVLFGLVYQAMGCGQVMGPLLMAAVVEGGGHWRWGTLFYVGLAAIALLVMNVFQRDSQAV